MGSGETTAGDQDDEEDSRWITAKRTSLKGSSKTKKRLATYTINFASIRNPEISAIRLLSLTDAANSSIASTSYSPGGVPWRKKSISPSFTTGFDRISFSQGL
jgi:hypothetical protein